MKLSDLASLIGGELSGDGSVDVVGVSPIEPAEGIQPGHITIADSQRNFLIADASAAAAIVVSIDTPASTKPLVRVKRTTLALAKILEIFHPAQRPAAGVHPTAVVAPTATLAADVHVGPNAVVKDGVSIGDHSVIDAGAVIGERVTIGAHCFIHSNATLYRDIHLGDRVIVHAGAVIGSDGFGYAQQGTTRIKIPQVGTVILEDDVEIGANTTIDRSTLGATVIKQGTKIDNLVQIAHNVVVGENTVICGLSGISGSVTIGDNVTLAGQVGLADHVSIGSNATIGAQSGVTKDLEGGHYYLGSPAVPIGQASRQYAVIANLPELSKRVRELERQIERLKDED